MCHSFVSVYRNDTEFLTLPALTIFGGIATLGNVAQQFTGFLARIIRRQNPVLAD